MGLMYWVDRVKLVLKQTKKIKSLRKSWRLAGWPTVWNQYSTCTAPHHTVHTHTGTEQTCTRNKKISPYLQISGKPLLLFFLFLKTEDTSLRFVSFFSGALSGCWQAAIITIWLPILKKQKRFCLFSQTIAMAKGSSLWSYLICPATPKQKLPALSTVAVFWPLHEFQAIFMAISRIGSKWHTHIGHTLPYNKSS